MIKCKFYDYKFKKFNQIEIDLDMNVFPCCHYYMDYAENNFKKNHYLSDIDISLKNKSMEEILNKFSNKFNDEIWEGKNCPEICKKTCDW
jgi:hypothetical protein